MEKTTKVRVWIEVTIAMEQPVMRSGESQVADFILPALDALREASVDVKNVWYGFDEQEV